MKLNKNNYYTTRNKYVSNSKISDYLKDPYFFYRKHILGEVEKKVTPSMQLGSAVDVWITEGEKVFRDTYLKVNRKTDPVPKGMDPLTKAVFEEVERICHRFDQTTIAQQLKGFTSQKILQIDSDLGLFEGICGIPDFFKIDDKKKIGMIVDLKTSETINPRKYEYKCDDFGYWRQAAMYRRLLREQHKDIKKWYNYHVVIQRDSDGINNIKLFYLPDTKIAEANLELTNILGEIKKEQHFKIQDVSFNDAVSLATSDNAPVGLIMAVKKVTEEVVKKKSIKDEDTTDSGRSTVSEQRTEESDASSKEEADA